MKATKAGKMTLKAIDGVFLTFSQEERAAISELLYYEGYEDTPEGLKKFIVDCAFEEKREDKTPPRRYLNIENILENPDAYINAASNLAQSIARAIKKARK